MFLDSYGNRRFPGLYRGLVYDNRDPLEKGRVRIQVPQVLGDAITDWAWPKRNPGATEVTPNVGVGVWVMFEGGDPSYPVWVGTFTSEYSYEDIDHGLPAGGLAGQILTKSSNADYDAAWMENYAEWTSVVKHYVRAGATLTKGQAVYVSSSDGTNIVVSTASNATEPRSSKTLGIVAQDLNTTSNKYGYVVSEGLLGGLNTSSADEGDPVWLGVDGALIFGLTNKPIAPAHLVFLGIVTKKAGGNGGEIFVRVQNGFELNELHNVLIGTNYSSVPADNDILAYDSSSSLWKNQTATQAGLISTSDTGTVTNTMLAHSSLTVNGSSISLGGSATVSAAPSGSAGGKLSGTYPNPGLNATIDDLSDVAITSAAAGEILSYTGSGWANSTAGYRYVGKVPFTSNGSFSKASYPYLRAIKVICLGGGGGGGGAATTAASQNAIGGSGSGGNYAESWISNISGLESSITVTVGAGGTGGAAGANTGSDGGTSGVYYDAGAIISSATSSSGSSPTVYTLTSSAYVPPVGSYVTVSGFSGSSSVLALNVTNELVTATTSNTFSIASVSRTNTNVAPTAGGSLWRVYASAPGGNGGAAGTAANVTGGYNGTAANTATTTFGDVIALGEGTAPRVYLNATWVVGVKPGGNRLYPTPLYADYTTTGSAGLSPSSSSYQNPYGVGGSGGVNAQSQATARVGGAGMQGIVIVELYA